jgi:hypothetical protein
VNRSFSKILNFEFWPWKVFYAPLMPYYLFLSAKCRSLTFPSIVNTCLDGGGFFNENKKEILSQIPSEYLPTSIYVQPKQDFTGILEELEEKNIAYPLIAKPLDGQRGKNVELIYTESELLEYFLRLNRPFLIQEFIDYDIELAVFYSRLPGQSLGVVSSITLKEFLSVEGDGKHTVEALVLANTRYKILWNELKSNIKVDLYSIPKNGQKVLLEPIGNHCRGTIFRNAEDINKTKAARTINKIMAQYDGFNYGRFDMKVKTIEDFYEGKNIKILELNGVNADAAHIFDPNYQIIRAYRDVAWHWNRLCQIANENRKLGCSPVPLKNILDKISQS